MSGPYIETVHDDAIRRVAALHARNVAAANLRPLPANPEPAYPPGGAVMLLPEIHVGGAERAMIALFKLLLPSLRWRGFAVLRTINDPALRAEMEALGAVVTGADACRAMIAGSDVVVAWVIPDLPSLLPPRGGSIKPPLVVAMSHSTTDSPWALRLMADDAGIDRYVAISTSALGPIPDARKPDAVVIPNPVDFARLAVTKSRAEVRAAWGVPAGAKVLGGLHRLSAEKYPEGLIAAIRHLPPEWVGVIVGEGYDRDRITRLVAAEAPGRVLLPGARLDVGNVLTAFDVALVASDYESFCLSLAEAVAAGCPTVATPVGVARDHPGFVRSIPLRASGPTIAQEVLADLDDPTTVDRVNAAQRASRAAWDASAVASAWLDLLRPHLGPASLRFQEELKPSSARRVADPISRLQKAKACPDRGCKTGCNTARCERYRRSVSLSECMKCEMSA